MMNFRKSRAKSRRNSTNMMMDIEKWRPYTKKSSRRGHDEFSEDDSDSDDPKHSSEMQNWVEEQFGSRNVGTDSVDQDVEVQLTKKQTFILATLLPDEILLMDRFDIKEPKRFVGVLMMADVSGYTALSERYNNTGKGGTYRLTVTLNTYLGALIEIIYSHGGDVLKFAGDAFLALWKTDKKTYLCHTIHAVITCALVIQHCYARYETDVKVNLKVKLAISAGNLMFSPIGVGIDMNYVIFGLPVIEAKLAESVCVSGEVKLTPTAWAHCYSRNYDYVLHEDGHVTIKTILYDPRESVVSKPFLGFGSIMKPAKKQFTAIESLPDTIWDSSPESSELLRNSEALSLRKTILVCEERNIGSDIRKFMIRPVLTQIDAHQPLEYLTEMRQVSILFITLKPRECPPAQLITIVNNSYQITCEMVLKSMGCVNKIILFDKDVMILVVFGLRGFKHESEAQAALKCAYSIKKSVSALDGVREVSIGVTTGQVYCGVIGHPLRREFTVIGAIVNKAARLMCYFRNKISCDETTYVKSKMSSNGFTLQPKIELKGIKDAGKVFEYTEEIRVKQLNNIETIPPLLNRHDEMEYFENWLDESHCSFRDFDALLLIGESRIGKSRLLEWMARHARNLGYHVCHINLTSIHSANQYLALSQIMNQILGLKDPIRGFEKEEKIISLLSTYDEDLCYLNNIIKVRFAYHEGIYLQDEEKRKEKAKGVFTKLINAFTETYVICLDDLQNLDASSWEFISTMFQSLKFFVVLTCTRGKFSNVHKWLYSVFINSNVRKIVLGPLSSKYIAPLACQILDVDAVPNDLCNTLRTKCHGMPGQVESFIVHLFSTGALEVMRVTDSELEEYKLEELQLPEPALLRAQALDARDQPALDEFLESEATGEIRISVVTQKEELKTNLNVQNVDALIMVMIDVLTPYQQLLLKIASVIGNLISRDLLENIMYENNPLITAKAVKRLFAMRILMCATYSNRRSRNTLHRNTSLSMAKVNSDGISTLVCECSFEHDPEVHEGLPKYAFCRVMKFRNKNSRKTCYELLPMNQKKEFHSRIVNYLENNKQKCPNCGGAIMIVQSETDLAQFEEQPTRFVNKIITSELHSDEESENESIAARQSSKSASRSKSESIYKKESYGELLKTASEMLSNYNKSKTSGQSNNAIIKKSSDDEDRTEEPTKTSRRSTKRVTMSSLQFKDVHREDTLELKIYEKFRPILEANRISEWVNLGLVDSEDQIEADETESRCRSFAVPIEKGSFAVPIEKGVSQTDFNKCTCADLNIVIYEQLIYHAQQAELAKKSLNFLIHFSYLNLLASNYDTSLMKLEEAEKCVLQYNNTEDPLTSFEKKRFIGKIYSIRAAAYLMSGKLLAAKMEMERAVHIYNLHLHKVSDLLKAKRIFKVLKIKGRTYRKNEDLMKTDTVFCLNTATLIYSTYGEEKLSRIAALRALQLVQTVNCPNIDVFDTLTNIVQIEIDRGTPENTVEVERVIKHVLRRLQTPVRSNELYAAGKLFMSLFRARVSRGALPRAIHAGFRSIAISHFLHANHVTLAIIPELFYVLFSRRRIEEAIDVVRLPLLLGENVESYTYESWYYALCMDMILDGGFQLESPSEINRFAEHTMYRTSSQDPARRRLVVNLWTYWLRSDFDKKAKRYENEALSWLRRDEDEGSVACLLSSLRLAEGLLESLARKVDDLRKVVDMMELRSVADRELSKLEKDCRLTRALHPRWLLLKAYSHLLSGRTSNAITLFNQAMEEARRMHSHLEQALARAALSNSRFWVQHARTGQFMDWQSGVMQARGSWHHLLYKMTTIRQ